MVDGAWQRKGKTVLYVLIINTQSFVDINCEVNTK
jgi:hypothetical protein